MSGEYQRYGALAELRYRARDLDDMRDVPAESPQNLKMLGLRYLWVSVCVFVAWGLSGSVAVTLGSFIVAVLSVLARESRYPFHDREEEKEKKTPDAALFLQDCWSSPVVRSSREEGGWSASAGDIKPRKRNASDYAWNLSWQQDTNADAFEEVFSLNTVLSAEILEELLAGEKTRLPVLTRLSQSDWATVRAWGEYQGERFSIGRREPPMRLHPLTKLTLCLLAVTPDIAKEIDIRGLVRVALGSTSKTTRELGIRVMSLSDEGRVLQRLTTVGH